MAENSTVLAVLLRERGQDRYGTFCVAYNRAVSALDIRAGGPPSRAQFHRWVTGGLHALPHTDHCRVLEHMLTGYTAAQLIAPCPDRVIPPPARQADNTPAAQTASWPGAGMAGVEAVFTSRAEFAAKVDPKSLIEDASDVRVAGLSLNLWCQELPDTFLLRLLSAGTRISLLFLDPDGDATAAREHEEQYESGVLATLTKVNIGIMTRLRQRLPADNRDRLTLAAYDETIRFNLILAGNLCVAQPYMPRARGIDSPTLLIRDTGHGGLYQVFAEIYDELAARSKPR
jgi:Domain of unknown function (DUF5919)